jgi:subtilase family serine protease
MKLIHKGTVRGISALITGVLSAVIYSNPAWSQSASNPTLSYSSAALIENHARALITQRIDEATLVELKGNTRPEMTAENDRGAVPDDFPLEHMLLQLQRPPELEKALQKFIEELHDPASSNFHKWLTTQQFGRTFGLAQQDLDIIIIWLKSHGFTVNTVYPSGVLIDFSGSARQVREAFHSEIHYLQVKGATHIANVRDPQIPGALAPAVSGVVSLHDFYPRAMHKMHGEYTFTSGGYSNWAVTPTDLATIYNLTSLFESGISGQGQSITVIEDSNVYKTADWNTFRSTFGLSGYTSGSFSQIHPAPPTGSNNCSNPGVVSGDEQEAIMDAEYASAAAPSATIVLASCASTDSTFGGLIALQNLINGSTCPTIVSISYGECEAQNGAAANAAYNSTYQQAVAEGVSVFVAAGDEGAASCDGGTPSATHGIGVSGFASTPYNVAVGGTDFGDTYANTNTTYWQSTSNSTYGSARSYIPEIPWNDSCAGVLISSYFGYSTTYGPNGFCNSSTASSYELLTATSGSGGPSGCATGYPSANGVVSGSCSGYAKPSWQSVVGNPNDGVRDVPDISLFSADGVWGHYYVYCDSDTADGGAPCTGAPSGWSGAGGTSFATPIMAGIQALVNQEVGSPQGNPNPVYYNLAAIEYGQSGNSSCNSSLGNGGSNSCIFHDVTQGDIDVDCEGSYNCYIPSGRGGALSTSNESYQIAYGATTGWDFATGIGTVNAYNLVKNWPKYQQPNCAATLSGNFTLSVPILTYAGQTYWADFQYVPNTMDFALTNAGLVADADQFSSCAPATLSTSLQLQIPAIIFNGISYWGDFQYDQGVNFTLTGAGAN